MSAPYLEEIAKLNLPDFYDMAGGAEALTAENAPRTMQINVGRPCNLACNHCHLECGPTRTEVMSRAIMEDCVKAFRENGFAIADITGGAPEMNPHLEWLIEQLAPIAQKVMVRSNLVILENEQYAPLMDVYERNKVEIICSMPCYGKDGVEDQRGAGTYEPIVRMLQRLNARGYGRTPDLKLNLAFNPGGPTLPPKQADLENTYRESLKSEHDIDFDSLFVMTNSPLGRFGKRIVADGTAADYMDLLISTFNKDNVKNVMCLDQVSVGWDGRLYDCDAHQAIDLPIAGGGTIADMASGALSITPRVVKTSIACFGCTAGSGSSCGGSLDGGNCGCGSN